MLALAAQILDSKTAAFDPSSFQDRYEEALVAHLKGKQAGMVVRAEPVVAPRRVINLMEALRRSVADDKKPPAPTRKSAPVAAARKRA